MANQTLDCLDMETTTVIELRKALFDQAQQNSVLRRQVEGLRQALAQVADGPCCETPGCSIDNPLCDAMQAHAALARVGGGGGEEVGE